MYSRLYQSILNRKFFVDIRQADALAAIVTKFLTRDVSGYSSKPLSASEPLEVRLVAAAPAADAPATLSASSQAGSASGPSSPAVAVIPLRGTMMKYGTMCSYGADEIAEAIDGAAADPKVEGVVLAVDSGGGAVDAVAPLIDAIGRSQRQGKPVVALCDLCASAAYYVACHCDEVLADNTISAEFGSIGVMMQFADYAKYYEKEGIQVHTIYSSLSDYKNAPFEAARRGEYAKIREEELDPVARTFQQAVKRQRGDRLDTTVEGILSGRMFFARDAVKHGLIDGIGSLEKAVADVHRLAAEAAIRRLGIS